MNAAVLGNSSGTVALGNASVANGTTEAGTSFTAVNTTATFTNASAAATQTVNLTDALRDTINYTITGGDRTGVTGNTISKAAVTIATNGVRHYRERIRHS
jgi:predicted ThiF/HesA family dinucleotide-utilizing enzyme